MKESKNQKYTNQSEMNNQLTWNLPHNDNSQDINSYPYLKLLGEICSLIKSNITESEPHTNSEFENSIEHIHSVPSSLDTQLYPYSTLLQNFITEVNLNNSGVYIKEENCDNKESLNCVMKDICHPLEAPSSSSVCNPFPDISLNPYDMTYASKLKHIACQSKQTNPKEHLSCTYNEGFSEVCFILRNLFPSIKMNDTVDMEYTEKLKNICDLVRTEDDSMDCETSLSHSSSDNCGWENVIKSEQFTNENSQPFIPSHKGKNRNKSLLRESRIKTEIVPDLQNVCNSNDFILNNERVPSFSHDDKDTSNNERYLFEALMKSVHTQSFLNQNNMYVKDGKPEASLLVKQEPSLCSFNSSLLGESGIQIIEQRLASHLKNMNET